MGTIHDTFTVYSSEKAVTRVKALPPSLLIPDRHMGFSQNPVVNWWANFRLPSILMLLFISLLFNDGSPSSKFISLWFHSASPDYSKNCSGWARCQRPLDSFFNNFRLRYWCCLSDQNTQLQLYWIYILKLSNRQCLHLTPSPPKSLDCNRYELELYSIDGCHQQTNQRHAAECGINCAKLFLVIPPSYWTAQKYLTETEEP